MIEDLKDIIREEISNIDMDLCQAVYRSVIGRAQKCIETDGHTFDQYS